MTSKAIPDLPPADLPLAGDELVHVVQDGNSRQAPLNEVILAALTVAEANPLYLQEDQNLADLDDPAAARANLGITVSPTSKGALVQKAADQVAADYTAGAPSRDIPWDVEVYDDLGFHDNAANNARLTIPAGVSKVRLSGSVRFGNNAVDQWAFLAILKNGFVTYPGVAQMMTEIGSIVGAIAVHSPVLAVVPGDWFTLSLEIEADASITITANRSWFAIEVVA